MEESKYYFPKEYKLEGKWLGMFEYKNLMILAAYCFGIYKLIGLTYISLIAKIYIFCILTMPIFPFVLVKINGENAISIFKIWLLYLIKPKRYIYVLGDKELDLNGNVKKTGRLFNWRNKFFVL